MNGYPQQFQDFVEAAVEGREPLCGGLLARDTVAVMYARTSPPSATAPRCGFRGARRAARAFVTPAPARTRASGLGDGSAALAPARPLTRGADAPLAGRVSRLRRLVRDAPLAMRHQSTTSAPSAFAAVNTSSTTTCSSREWATRRSPGPKTIDGIPARSSHVPSIAAPKFAGCCGVGGGTCLARHGLEGPAIAWGNGCSHSVRMPG